jgi:uncharacterized protein with ParB-like and HNH nuclease domain
VTKLLDDLETRFFISWKEEHDRREVGKYLHYFLGPIITSEKDGKKYIIDGQQRVTTLTLLLIHLNKLQKGVEKENRTLPNLIYSEHYGEKSFNLDVEERRQVLEALFTGDNSRLTNITSDNPSVKNIRARYEDIEYYFENDSGIKRKPTLFFIDWLTNNVDLIEIIAPTEEDGYTIFETMNDRGLRLEPYEMLKGYIIRNIAEDRRDEADTLWKGLTNNLQTFGENENYKDIAPDFFRDWLRAKYADMIRKKEAGSKPEDFEKISNAFHRWVRDNKSKIGLFSKESYFNFLHEMIFFSKVYMEIIKSENHFDRKFEYLYYNSLQGFTLQRLLIISAINESDSEQERNKKITFISRFIERLIVFRLFNKRRAGYSTMRDYVFALTKRIRNKDSQAIEEILKAESKDNINDISYYGLETTNKSFVKFVLARISSYIQYKSGIESSIADFYNHNYDIEHIIPDKFELHRSNFADENEFETYRNRLGALLLLPYPINRSHQDDPYEVKLEYYFGQNLLAKSLNKKCYSNNPGFLRYIRESNLPFKAYDHFTKIEINERQKLLQKIMMEIWP